MLAMKLDHDEKSLVKIMKWNIMGEFSVCGRTRCIFVAGLYLVVPMSVRMRGVCLLAHAIEVVGVLILIKYLRSTLLGGCDCPLNLD